MAEIRLLLISDTHIPKRARDLPPPVWDAIDEADVVVHAGDWIDTATLDRVATRARRLVGVWGNNDGAEIRRRLPRVAEVGLLGVRLAVVHETGPARGREQRCAEEFADVDVLVFGHSHIPWDSTTSTGLRLLNPGSPTDRRRQPACTYLTALINDGAMKDVSLHRLPPRNPKRDRSKARESVR